MMSRCMATEKVRSIRLNKQWRAIYVIKDDGEIEFVEIIEVTPHDY
jgi:toxin HigB-1